MGMDFYKEFQVARETMDSANDALKRSGTDVFQLIGGPLSVLTQTENAQPSILTVSIAILRVLESEGGLNLDEDVAFAMGHSLGEYSALVAAGSLSLETAVQLVRTRGQAMTDSLKSLDKPTSMLAMVINYDKKDEIQPEIVVAGAKVKRYNLKAIQDRLEAINTCVQSHELPEGSVAQISNSNSSRQIVLSGTSDGVEEISNLLQGKGLAHPAVQLPVSAPFHCSLLKDAQSVMSSVLDKTQFKDPRIPIVSNVSAEAISDSRLLSELLARQITSTVCFYRSMLYLKQQGVNRWLCIGPGKAIANLVKKEFPSDDIISVANIRDLKAFKL